MKEYIVTKVVTYAPNNQKSQLVNNYAARLKHRIIKGTKPVTSLVKAIKDHCGVLDRKFPRTRPLLVQPYSLKGDTHQITVYSGNPDTMSGQPKAAVIYLAKLAGVIDMDSLEAGTIDFGQETTETISRKEEQS